MVESQSPFVFLGLAFSISGVISLGYGFVERLVSTGLFSLFLTVTPNFLYSQFRGEPAIAWLKARSSGNLYDRWDMSLIYLFLLSCMLAMTVGFWVLLVLRILGTYNIGTSGLIIWFLALCVTNWIAAANQTALEVKTQHKRATLARVKKYMVEDPLNALKRSAYYFLRNWIQTPYTIVKLLSTILLFILLLWPAWLLKGVKILKGDLNDKDTRTQYYITYGVLASVAGLLLTFFFK